MDKYFYSNNRETIDKITDIDKKIHDEYTKERPEKSFITKMMYEQMLNGLYLNNTQNNQ